MSKQAALELALVALKEAKRLWPTRHPAQGMIVGIEEDVASTYNRIEEAIVAVQAAINTPTQEPKQLDLFEELQKQVEHAIHHGYFLSSQ